MPEQSVPQNQPFSWRGFFARHEGRVAIVLLFLITLPVLTKVFTSDFGTHIAIGRQIVQTRDIPDREFLNYPSLGQKNSYTEWGFQVLLYLVHAAGGMYAVSFLCWAVVFGVFLFIHRATVLRGADPLLAAAALFAFSGFLRIRIQPRPEIFTYLLTAMTIYLLSEYYFGKRKKLIYLLPPAMVFWANVHATYLMGLLLCGAFFADALARAAWNRELRWERLRTWVVPPLATGLAGLVLCGLNPQGYEPILAPLHIILKSGGGAAGSGMIQSAISELTPVKGTGMYVYYKAAAVFAVVSILLGVLGRRVYLLDLFLFSIAFKGAWDSARAVSMMGLFLSPGASLSLTGFLSTAAGWFLPKAAPKEKEAVKEGGRKKDRSREKEKRKDSPKPHPSPAPRSWFRAAAASVLVAALVVFGSVTLLFSFSQLEYGVGMTEHKFSFGAAEFLRKNRIPGNMFNFFDIGGFLDWQLYPQALTFTDGRAYNPQVFMEHQMVTSTMPGWQDVLRKYGITYAVLKSMDSSGMILPVVQALTNDPGWALVYADGLFVVFVKNGPETREYIKSHEIPKSTVPQQIIWESYHYMYLGVSPVLAYRTMSNMYEVMGNRQAAIEALKRGIAYSDDPYLRALLMQLEGRR